jgi:transcriptional regulator with XRE-family HTH domain
MEKFGEYVKSLRQKLDLSLREVARRIEIEPSYLSDIERGKRNAPAPDKLEKLASVLGLSETERHCFYDLAKIGKKIEIAEDVQNIITENEKIPVLCRKIKEKNINVDDLLRKLERK